MSENDSIKDMQQLLRHLLELTHRMSDIEPIASDAMEAIESLHAAQQMTYKQVGMLIEKQARQTRLLARITNGTFENAALVP